MSTAALPQVTKRYADFFVRGPGSGKVRRECRGADTVDGVWSIDRLDDTGTPWVIRHVPSGAFVAWNGGRRDANGRPAPRWEASPLGHAQWFGSLKKALLWVASNGDEWASVLAPAI